MKFPLFLLWGLLTSLAVIAGGASFNPAAAESRTPLKLEYFSIPHGRLAFTYINGKTRDIYVLDFEKSAIVPLVQTPVLDEYPTWSPDGRRVVFYSDMTGDRELYSVGSDGTGLKRLTNSPGADEDPDYSPDGKQIVFSSARYGGMNIFTMNADGSDPRALTNGRARSTVPRWSPRGDEIVYSTDAYWPGWDIVMLSIATRQGKRLTSGYRSYCRASWSDDGSSFLFTYGTGDEIDVYSMQKGESVPTRITQQPGKEYDAVYADDGKKLFFVGEPEPGKSFFQIYVYDVASKKTTKVTSGAGSARFLSWTPFPQSAGLLPTPVKGP